MKRLTIALLCACTTSSHGAVVEQLDAAQTALRANQQIMRNLGEGLEKAKPHVTSGIQKIDEVQNRKHQAMARVAPTQKTIERVSTAVSFLPGITDTGKLLKASANAYSHAIGLSQAFDATAKPLRAHLKSIESDLAAITKDGGLIDEIVAAQEEAVQELGKARSLLTKPSDQPSEEFDF